MPRNRSSPIRKIKDFVTFFGKEGVFLLHLTFPDDVQDSTEAQKRFHSLCTNVLSRRYHAWLRIYERSDETGRIHYHVLIAPRPPFSPVLVSELRAEYAFWPDTAKRHRFGRVMIERFKHLGTQPIYYSKFSRQRAAGRWPQDRNVRFIDGSDTARAAMLEVQARRKIERQERVNKKWDKFKSWPPGGSRVAE
jgi:hypothetical protein